MEIFKVTVGASLHLDCPVSQLSEKPGQVMLWKKVRFDHDLNDALNDHHDDHYYHHDHDGAMVILMIIDSLNLGF